MYIHIKKLITQSIICELLKSCYSNSKHSNRTHISSMHNFIKTLILYSSQNNEGPDKQKLKGHTMYICT